jgi:hypothetical protein
METCVQVNRGRPKQRHGVRLINGYRRFRAIFTRHTDVC